MPHGSGQGKTRWPVERSIAWRHSFRRGQDLLRTLRTCSRSLHVFDLCLDLLNRLTAKRDSAAVLYIIPGKTTVAEAGRMYGLLPTEVARGS
ncbi:transposase [Pandoraea fibrosis]|uniref:Transposase n=1 Tax=Pandoraea fibrosis TaxID=1891094 RepID=A0A5E4W9P3_9BURK|nr:transposase [Pandoraea fibrosis]